MTKSAVLHLPAIIVTHHLVYIICRRIGFMLELSDHLGMSVDGNTLKETLRVSNGRGKWNAAVCQQLRFYYEV